MTTKRLIDANALECALKDTKIGLAIDKGKMFNLVESAPTVDAVEVVHGHWDEGKGHGYCCCSNCRDVYILEEWLTDGKWNYCPNCGAKMDGDGNA